MKLGERNWTEIEDLAGRVVVAPLGSLEQHGHHLPLLTDTFIGTEIARRAEEQLEDAALFLPPLWIGASHHHRAFGGTVSLGNDTYVRVLVDVLESLIGSGFRRIFLLNAHGGNIIPGQMATYDVQLRHRDKSDLWLAFSSWWTIAAERIRSLSEVQQEMVTHACEQETSMVLRLRPELVKPEAARGANIPFESAFYCPDFNMPSRVAVPRAFDQLSRTGAFGHPEIGTAEKGELLISAAVAEVVAFVREFAAWKSFKPY
ncbi:MAG TPA: creatininase family protein [Armatimonadota bacterium]|nr:creatininase family protein [Armatimonadota bacterium]